MRKVRVALRRSPLPAIRHRRASKPQVTGGVPTLHYATGTRTHSQPLLRPHHRTVPHSRPTYSYHGMIGPPLVRCVYLFSGHPARLHALTGGPQATPHPQLRGKVLPSPLELAVQFFVAVLKSNNRIRTAYISTKSRYSLSSYKASNYCSTSDYSPANTEPITV